MAVVQSPAWGWGGRREGGYSQQQRRYLQHTGKKEREREREVGYSSCQEKQTLRNSAKLLRSMHRSLRAVMDSAVERIHACWPTMTASLSSSQRTRKCSRDPGGVCESVSSYATFARSASPSLTAKAAKR